MKTSKPNNRGVRAQHAPNSVGHPRQLNLSEYFEDNGPFASRRQARGAKFTFAKPSRVRHTVSPSAEDLNRVAVRIADALRLARDNFGEVAFTHSDRDLEILQRILDNGVLSASDTYELQCLGLVFGDVLARRADLRWVTVEDACGRDPALQYQSSSLILFPMTMISKPVEEGQRVNVAELMRLTEREVAGLKKEATDNDKAAAKPWWKFW